jgi:hypothetical protein
LKPLPLEASLPLPAEYAGLRMLEVTRLALAAGAGSVARDAIFKALFIRCQQLGVDRIVVTGRSPVDRMYQRIAFRDVFEEGIYYPMSHVAGLPHRVMTLPIGDAFAMAPAPIRDFCCLVRHPDLLLRNAPAVWGLAMPEAA